MRKWQKDQDTSGHAEFEVSFRRPGGDVIEVVRQSWLVFGREDGLEIYIWESGAHR